MIAADVHMTVGTVKKYLDSLIAKKLIGEDGTPVLKSKDKKFFTLPRECLQTQAIQTRMAASRVTAKNRQARFSYLVAKRR